MGFTSCPKEKYWQMSRISKFLIVDIAQLRPIQRRTELFVLSGFPGRHPSDFINGIDAKDPNGIVEGKQIPCQ